MSSADKKQFSQAKQVIGFRVVCNIMNKWGLSPSQMTAILGLQAAEFANFVKSPSLIQLNDDQLCRVSYLLNIHASLRRMFDNPDNVYGFMTMHNHNPFFDGKSPAELLSTGDIGVLIEISRRLCSGQPN